MSKEALAAGSGQDSLLVEAFYAYRQGLLRQPRSRALMPTRDFDALKFLGTVGWMSLEDRLHLRNLHVACGRGLTAARQGSVDEALAHYEQARQRLDLLKASELAWLLGVSTYQSGVAYLDFRRGSAEQACERLDCAMDADFRLEQAGLPVMQVHRIQQGHNLVRMELRLGSRETAITLAGMLAAYMESRIEDLPYHRDWKSKLLQAVPRGLLRAMIHQIVGETAGYLVTGNAPAKEWRVLIEACRLCQEPETAIFPQVQYALQAQHDRLLSNSEGYLLNLEHFFRFGIRDCPLLWYALLIEFVGFCYDADTSCSRQIREIILRDSIKWKGLPRLLRDCLNAPVGQRAVA